MDGGARERLSGRIIGCALEVHRALGPGLLESAYEQCLADELTRAGLGFERQKLMPVTYKTRNLDCGYRVDFVAEDRLILELKSVERITDLHRAQLLSYLRLSGLRCGLLLNFNSLRLKDGLVRIVM